MTIAALGLLMPLASAAIRTVSDGLSSAATQASTPKEKVRDEFLGYAKMSPMERMRASILKGMNLTENDVKAMSPADQKKLEEKIKELIKQEIEKDLTKKGQLIDIAV
jgi:hypothetical protein